MKYPNWFEITARSNFETQLAHLKDEPILCLQIGAYVGHASMWMVDNILTHPESMLYDVDTWEGSEEPMHNNFDWSNVYSTYMANIDSLKVVPRMMTSDEYFKLPQPEFDFIYVDGDHTAVQVWKDIENSWAVLKTGGIIAMDDYTWGAGLPPYKRPASAIDKFLREYEYELLVKGGQVWARKV
jgi:predicted O-methyltransferase YrrM